MPPQTTSSAPQPSAAPDEHAEPDETVRLGQPVLSDDTRPVPRDRGPVTPESAAPGGPPAPVPAPPAEDPHAAAPGTDADRQADADPAAAEPVAAGTATPGSGPVPPDDEDHETQDIRFAPGEAPGDHPAPADASSTTVLPPGALPSDAPGPDDTVPAAAGAAPPGDPGPGDQGTGDRGPGDQGPGDQGPGPGGPGGPPRGDDVATGRPWWRRPAVLAPAAAVVVLGAAYGADLLVAGGDVPRNTVIAGVDVGGLSPAAASERLENELAPRVGADHVVVADDVELPLSPAAAGVTLDVERTVDAVDDQPLNPWTRLVTLFSERAVEPVLAVQDDALGAQVEAIAAQVDRAPVDATITLDGTTPTVVTPEEGRSLDRAGAAEAITAALASGGDPATPIELPVEVAEVSVDAAEAQRVLDETVTPALAAPVTVTSQDGATSAEIPVEAIAASLTFTPQEDGVLAVAVDPAHLQEATGDDLAEFGTPAQDARFEISGGSVTVVPSIDGQGVDPAELAGQLLAVLPQPAPRTVTAQLGPVPADLTTEEAQALGIREEISSFTTTTTNSASGTNIRVVAEEVDGALVMPGETFSLNTFTGPRGRAQGYVPANVISGGELSTAVGGGISQFATTMFNAVFFAGLEDVYHKPHSFYISRYPAGREATVYEGQIDLQWRNDGDTGVFVDTRWEPRGGGGGSITVTFYGTKRYEVEAIEGARTNFRQPAVQEKVDDGDCIPQSGVQGFDITVTRVFRDLQSGAEIRRETFDTTYAAEAVIRCVAPEPEPEADAEPAPEGETAESPDSGD
ncbi:VanW family protein [Geodermatophilus sp. SYSU D00697]